MRSMTSRLPGRQLRKQRQCNPEVKIVLPMVCSHGLNGPPQKIGVCGQSVENVILRTVFTAYGPGPGLWNN